jgi:single-stranded-DNA-specific exonuclease
MNDTPASTALITNRLSLGARAWHWRGGNMEMMESASAWDDGLSDDLVTQLLLARGVPREDLNRQRAPTLREFLPDPSHLQDMDKAAIRIAQAIRNREAVAVYGDYDVDGATSAALLIRLFRMCGHDARHYIPDRLLEGYGPTGEALVRLGQEGAQLVVTVDCGAMAHDALAMAADAGWK